MKKYNSNLLLSAFLFYTSLLFSCQHSSENSSVTVDSTAKIDSVKNIDSTKAFNSIAPHNSTSLKSGSLFPKPANWVADYEHILDEQSFNKIVALIQEFQDKTSVEIAVVTTSTFAPYDSIGSYSVALGNEWGIGLKEINNGILLVVSVTQRQVRISTGLGMDQLLPDDMCYKIVYENILPSFKQEKYSEGIISGVSEIIRMLEAQMKPMKL